MPELAATTVRTSERGPYRYPELYLAQGPDAIGVTGANTYAELYGRPWALALDRSRRLRLYRGDPAGGNYTEVTTPLDAAIFGPQLPATARRVALAFDQTARPIVAIEYDGEIKLTRWDATEGAYVQNVSVAGHDPMLLIDAAVTDPAGWPTGDWSVREAHAAGMGVIFRWAPDSSWRTNAITDSDVLLFYLTPDRLEVRARVQRELYATANLVHAYAAPVILDRAQAALGRWQLRVADADGEPLAQPIVSDAYLEDFIIAPNAADELDVGAAPSSSMRAELAVIESSASDELAIAAAPESMRATGDVAIRSVGDDLDVSATPQGMTATSSTVTRTEDDALDVGAAPAGPMVAEQIITPATAGDGLDAAAAPTTMRAQAT